MAEAGLYKEFYQMVEKAHRERMDAGKVAQFEYYADCVKLGKNTSEKLSVNPSE
jgi:hypothetical protein